MKILDTVFVYQLKESDQREWHCRFHRHGAGEWEIHYFLKGNGAFHNGGITYTLRPGSVFCSGPDENHAIITKDKDIPVSYYALLFEPDEIDTQITALLKNQISANQNRNIGTNYRFFFEELRERSKSPSENLKASAVHQLTSFLYLLSEKGHDFNTSMQGSSHIERALQIMHQKVDGDLTLKELAAKLKLTESYFVRLFRQHMKTAPMKYFTRLKIEAATNMLSTSDLEVQQIAEHLGFYSAFHFSRRFKSFTGYSPTAYRLQYRQNLGQSGTDKEIIIDRNSNVM